MNHLELTKHIRSIVKTLSVKCSVRKMTICGHSIIRVDTLKLDSDLTREDQSILLLEAVKLGFTWVQGTAISIDSDSLVHSQKMEFYI